MTISNPEPPAAAGNVLAVVNESNHAMPAHFTGKATEKKYFTTKRISNKNVVNPTFKKVGSSADQVELTELKLKIAGLENDLLKKDAEIEELNNKLSLVKTNMEQFSYVASHDLKEPLRMVTSYLGLLKNKFGAQLDDKANTYIDFAIDGGARLHTMFNGLLDLSQTGRVDERKVSVNFSDLVEEIKINLSKKIRETKAEIRVIAELPTIEVFEKSISKLLENLICNSLKFCAVDRLPVVEISAKEKEHDWEFCIADNGIGISACKYKQIFAVFSKLHSPLVYPGNGIGLAICKKAVEHHAGSIWIDSRVNEGSKFYFSIPKNKL